MYLVYVSIYYLHLIVWKLATYSNYYVFFSLSGGKLWDHLKSYIKQPASSPSKQSFSSINLEEPYAGLRLVFKDTNKIYTVNSCSSIPFQKDDKKVTTNCSNTVNDCDSVAFSLNLAISQCRSTTTPRLKTPVIKDQKLPSSLSCLVPLSSIENEDVVYDKVINETESKEKSLLKDIKLRSLSLDALNTIEPVPSGTSGLTKKNNDSEGSGTLSGISEDFGSYSENLHDLEKDFSENKENDDEVFEESIIAATTDLDIDDIAAEAIYESDDKLFDITSIIENSRKLLDNVNQTLAKSKAQMLRRISMSRDEQDDNKEDRRNEDEKDDDDSSKRSPIERKSSFDPDEFSCLNIGRNYSTTNATSFVTLSSVLDKYKSSHCPHIPESLIRVWLSQIVSAMEALHNQGLIWG